MNQSTKLIQKFKQRDYEWQLLLSKVGRVITEWGAIEKNLIAIAILEKLLFLEVTKNISYFGGSNNMYFRWLYNFYKEIRSAS